MGWHPTWLLEDYDHHWDTKESAWLEVLSPATSALGCIPEVVESQMEPALSPCQITLKLQGSEGVCEAVIRMSDHEI